MLTVYSQKKAVDNSKRKAAKTEAIQTASKKLDKVLVRFIEEHDAEMRKGLLDGGVTPEDIGGLMQEIRTELQAELLLKFQEKLRTKSGAATVQQKNKEKSTNT